MTCTRWFRPSVIRLGVMAMFLAVSSESFAAEKIFLAGAEGGIGVAPNYYTYVGLIAPLPGNTLGDGFVQRYWMDYFGYTYTTSTDIDAQAIGLEGALGYQKSGAAGWAAAYAGIRYNNTWLAPDDPFNRNRGEQVWAKGQIEGEANLGADWRLSGIGSYIFRADGFWTRLRLTRRVKQDLFTGPELIHMGDPNFRAWQFDWVVTGFRPFGRWEVGIKAGARITEGTGVVGLIGFELLNIF